jgi:hypothetical protein
MDLMLGQQSELKNGKKTLNDVHEKIAQNGDQR